MVVVPVPPLRMPNRPVTSLPPKPIAPLNRAPAVVDLTGRAWLRLLMVVEPLTPTEKKPAPEVEATAKIGRVWEEVEATT